MNARPFLTLLLLVSPLTAQDGAGPLVPPSGPQDGTYRTLGEIWDKLLELQAQNDALATQNTALVTQVQQLQGQLDELPLETALLVLRNLEEDLPWREATVDPDPLNNFVGSLAFSPSGVPGISYFEGLAENLRYATRVEGTWQFETVDDSGAVGGQSSLAFTADGRPAIAYQDSGDPGVGGDETLKYAVHNGVSWDIQTLPGSGGQSPVLAFGGDGHPRICHSGTDAGGTGGIVFLRFDGTAWQSSVLAASSFEVDMVLRSDDQPVIVYSEFTTFPEADVKSAVFDGTDWSVSVIDDSGLANGGRIDLRPGDAPSVIYQTQGALRHATFEDGGGGPTWQSETIVADTGLIQRSYDFEIDEDGLPSVMYATVAGVHFAILVAAEWELELASPGSGNPLKFALNGSGQPAAAFGDGEGLSFLERAPFTEP